MEIELRQVWESSRAKQALRFSPIDIEAAVVYWTAWIDVAFDGTLPVCDVTAAQLFEYWVWVSDKIDDYRKAACYTTADATFQRKVAYLIKSPTLYFRAQAVLPTWLTE